MGAVGSIAQVAEQVERGTSVCDFTVPESNQDKSGPESTGYLAGLEHISIPATCDPISTSCPADISRLERNFRIGRREEDFYKLAADKLGEKEKELLCEEADKLVEKGKEASGGNFSALQCEVHAQRVDLGVDESGKLQIRNIKGQVNCHKE